MFILDRTRKISSNENSLKNQERTHRIDLILNTIKFGNYEITTECPRLLTR